MYKDLNEIIPVFSIIMPVYNVKKYLALSIHSILAQTFGEFELILIDDGSTDGCEKICDEFAEKNKKITVYHQENKGLLAARRAGIKRAKGNYIIHVDSDDLCSVVLLESLKSVIDSYEPDMIIYHYSRLHDDGTVDEIEPIYKNEIKMVPKEEILKIFASTVKLNSMCTKCTNRNKVDIEDDYTGYGRLNMAEDELQSVALIENCETFIYISQPLYYYRINVKSITNVFDKRKGLDSIKAKKRVHKMLIKCYASPSIISGFQKKYIHCINSYILEYAYYAKHKREFYGFRSLLKKEEIKFLDDNAVNLIDRAIYRCCQLDLFIPIKLMSYVHHLHRKGKFQCQIIRKG